MKAIEGAAPPTSIAFLHALDFRADSTPQATDSTALRSAMRVTAF
jgi:hypothetical protein